MLGNSGAGKTTYVSLMYAAMHEGVCGFRVRASDDAHHRQLVADAKAIRAGAYPAATHRRACYDLALSYNGSEVMPFSWRDHRGGAASGRTSDARDVAELNQDLLDSDAIVMFVDGAELVNDPRAAAQMVGRLSSHILRALHSREEFLTPVVIAITKCDLIDLGDARVRGALDAPLRELVGAVRASRHVQGTVGADQLRTVAAERDPAGAVHAAVRLDRHGNAASRGRAVLQRGRPGGRRQGHAA